MLRAYKTPIFATGQKLTHSHHTRYITLFFKGAYSVIGFYEVMRMFLAGLMHFLR